jgi:DNA-binding transcriptional ArsR family regulator
LALPGDLAGVRRVAASFRGVAHPTRLRIVEELREGDALSPTQLHRRLEPKVGLGNIAHHARELKDLGLLAPAGTRPVRGAVEHFYRLSPHGIEMLELVDRVAASPHAQDRHLRRRAGARGAKAG